MRRYTTIVIATLACLGFSSRSSAWEFDVHYLLTFWIGTQVGFSRADATEIAAGDQGFDDSTYHSAIGIMCLVGLKGDLGAAQTLQQNHFPSDARLPSPPPRRIVTPGSRSARIAIDAAMPRSDPHALEALGQALHPFQDSWSHQGVPDVPLNLRPELSCAHPVTRGGWRSHNADLTHLHVAEVLEVAHETCTVLDTYLRLHPALRDRGVTPVACDSLDAKALTAFATAATKTAKDEWALAHTAESRFTASTRTLTIPGDAPKEGTLRIVTPIRRDRPANAPADLVVTAQNLLVTWATQGNIERAVSAVNWMALRDQFVDGPRVEGQEDVIRWCRKFMTMYLVADHAAVNDAGHGDRGHPRYAALPETTADSKWTTQPLRLERRLTPNDFLPLDDVPQTVLRRTGPIFALVVQASTEPYDSVTFIWGHQADKGWRIIRMIGSVG